jgi:hypothetical protein
MWLLASGFWLRARRKVLGYFDIRCTRGSLGHRSASRQDRLLPTRTIMIIRCTTTCTTYLVWVYKYLFLWLSKPQPASQAGPGSVRTLTDLISSYPPRARIPRPEKGSPGGRSRDHGCCTTDTPTCVVNLAPQAAGPI